MLTSQYLRRQAALCLRIAAAVDDQSVIASLLLMAEEISVKADEIDPSLCSNGNGCGRPEPSGQRPIGRAGE
ncbi:MAG TPA: hypothetical protein VGN55_17315 [Xanthobacteraceae bacterium]|jgi:hypothetical protein